MREGERELLRKNTPFSHPTFLLTVSMLVGTKSRDQAQASLQYITYPTVFWLANHNLCDTYLNLRYLHPDLCNITLLNITPSLKSSTPRGNGCAQFKFPSLLSHFSLIYHGFWLKIIHQRIQTNARMHHVVIIVIIVMLTLCDSPKATHYTKFLLSHIHVNTTNLFNISCTLVAVSVILRRLESIWHKLKWSWFRLMGLKSTPWRIP